jgi:hypothetical protein
VLDFRIGFLARRWKELSSGVGLWRRYEDDLSKVFMGLYEFVIDTLFRYFQVVDCRFSVSVIFYPSICGVYQ